MPHLGTQVVGLVAGTHLTALALTETSEALLPASAAYLAACAVARLDRGATLEREQGR